MPTTRHRAPACLLGAVLLLTGCAGAQSTGAAPTGAAPTVPPAAATAAADPAAPTADGAATTGATTVPAGPADEAARAACAAIDAIPLGAHELALQREQQRGLTAAAEQLRTAATSDPRYGADAETVASAAAAVDDAVALVEEHGEDADAWDPAVQEAWGAYAVAQADRFVAMMEMCETVDPSGG